MTAPTLHGIPSTALLDPATVSAHDALVLVGPSPLSSLARALGAPVAAAVEAAEHADASLSARRARPPVVVAAPGLPGGRLVLAPTAPLTDDTDDARLIVESTTAAVARAVEAGARRPLLVVGCPDAPRFERAREVAALA